MGPTSRMQSALDISKLSALVRFTGLCLLTIGFVALASLITFALPGPETKFQEIRLLSMPHTSFVQTLEEVPRNVGHYEANEERFRVLSQSADEGKMFLYSNGYGDISYTFSIRGEPFYHVQDSYLGFFWGSEESLRLEGQVMSREIHRLHTGIVLPWILLLLGTFVLYTVLTSSQRMLSILFPLWSLFRTPQACRSS